MKKIMILLSAVLFCLAPAAAATADSLALKDITGGIYSPGYVYGVTPMADGESYSQLSDDRKRIVRHSFKTGKEIGTVFDVEKAKGVKLKGFDGYVLSPDENRILIQTQTKAIYRRSFTAVYYIYDVRTGKLEPLSDGGPQQVPLFSPDGNQVAFVRGGNLFLVKLLYGNAESQVTKDGKFNEIINGIPDWVNEEEFSTNRSFDFNADGTMLAWVRYDESQVPIYDMQEFKGLSPERMEYDEYPGSYRYKYPVAGARNATVSVLTFDIKNRVTRTMKVPMDSDSYVPRIKFTDNADKLAIVTLNRLQNQMDIYIGNPRSTECTLAVRETAKKYIGESAYGSLKFFGNNFAYLSDRDGFRHLYLYNLSGQLVKQVTRGSYDVTDFYGRDPKTGAFYYASRQESPLRKAVYCTDKNGREKKLSTETGTNSAIFSQGLRYFMNVYSSAALPPVTTLRSAADGKLLTTLVDNAALKQRIEPLLAQHEFFTFTTSEGVQLNGWMVKPRDFDPAKRYPVIMYQYSGPGSQEVTDSWNLGFFGGALYESYMAGKGYIYVIVDGRGTGGRGAEFEQCTYLQLGGKESKDQVETALYLGKLPYVDKGRIAIWGWSFGGFNTLMSMSEGRPAFRAGVAVAAPSNWKYYDTVYTERYMRTPQQNAQGYADCPISRAAQLSGSLLLIHGTADDNVHFRNFVEVSEAYVQADKPFAQQLYTNRNHNIYGGNTRYHLFKTITRFFDEKLK